VDVDCFVPATPSFISSRKQQARRAATSTNGAVCLGVLTGYQRAQIFDEVRQHVSSPLLSLRYLTVLRWASITSVCNCSPARCSLVVLCAPLCSFAVFSHTQRIHAASHPGLTKSRLHDHTTTAQSGIRLHSLSNLCRDGCRRRVTARRVISVQVTTLIIHPHLLASDRDCRSVARIYKHYFSALGLVLVVFAIQ